MLMCNQLKVTVTVHKVVFFNFYKSVYSHMMVKYNLHTLRVPVRFYVFVLSILRHIIL